MKLKNVWEQLWHILMYLFRKYEHKHIKNCWEPSQIGSSKPIPRNGFTLLYFSVHLGHILMSVAAAAYVTQIPIVSLDFQQFVCLSVGGPTVEQNWEAV